MIYTIDKDEFKEAEIMDTARIIKTGRSQAVRLPRRYRFSGSEVVIRKEGNNVILSPISRKDALEAFLALPCCPDFSIERDTAQQVQARELF